MEKKIFISVYDKTNLEDFVKNLIKKVDYEIVALGDTYTMLKNAGIKVKNLTDIINTSKAMENFINEFELVIINLKPFDEIEQKTSDIDEMLNETDITSTNILRAAVKNYKKIIIITDPKDYEMALSLNEFGKLKLAAKALRTTSDYDKAIYSAIFNEIGESSYKNYSLEKISDLGHGENHNQKASIYKGRIMADYRVEDNKPLTYNAILNITEATNIVSEFYDVPSVAIVRHTKPCGVAIGKSIYEAYTKAFDCDPLSTYYGTVAFSKTVDLDTAKHLNSMAVEVIIAPDYEDKALELLKENPDLKIVHLNTSLKEYRQLQVNDIAVTPFGVLIQDKNNSELNKDIFKVVTKEKPTTAQIEDAVFGWKIAKYAKTNAAIVVKSLKTVAIGQGYTNTITAIENVLNNAADMAKDAVLISDCAIPAEDCIYAAVQNRISLIIQPGGMTKDKNVIETADKYGITMITTGIKNYTH